MPKFAPRVHVLLASEAPIGVVIRRGPSKSVCTLLWNRRTDKFTLGQWLKGRIYERRSDLSSDGKHLIYFAMNGKWESETRGSWTAISCAPYLKAITLFGKGDCWHGGGLFTSRRTYWLNDGYGHLTLRSTTKLARDQKFQPTEYFGGECLGVYYPRLLRDGWKLVERHNNALPSPVPAQIARIWIGADVPLPAGPKTEAANTPYFAPVCEPKNLDVFEKSVGEGWTLRKLAHAQIDAPLGKGCYWDEHDLVHVKKRARIACPNWEWADLDDRRLVWAADGKIFAGNLTRKGLRSETVLFDFNGMTFQELKAPY